MHMAYIVTITLKQIKNSKYFLSNKHDTNILLLCYTDVTYIINPG